MSLIVFWIITPPHVLYALWTLTCCPFLVFALPLPPVVLVLQPPLCGTRSHLAFATLPLSIPSVAFLKLSASSRPSAPPSGSSKCLRFSLWLTLHSKHLFAYLLTYVQGGPIKTAHFLRYHIFATTADIITRFMLKCSEIKAENNKRQFF